MASEPSAKQPRTHDRKGAFIDIGWLLLFWRGLDVVVRERGAGFDRREKFFERILGFQV